MTTDRFDALVARFQTETSEEAKAKVLDDIAALFMPIVETRVLNKTYPSFNIEMYDGSGEHDGAAEQRTAAGGTYHDEMRLIARATLTEMTPKYEVGGEDCFEAFMLQRVRAAIREFLHTLDTLDYIYIMQHGVTPKEHEMLMGLVVEQNDRLILYIIKKHYPSYRHNHMSDMQQCGRMALAEFALGYDFGKINPKTNAPYKFSTYITSYILDALKSYICDYHDITPHYAVQIKRFERAEAELRRRGAEEPTLDQVANEMGVGIDAARKVFNVQRRMNTIPIEDNERDKRIPNPLYDTPEEIVEKEEFRAQLNRAILTLTSEQQKVIRATFYTHDGKEASLAEVSKRLGWDVVRTRRVKNQALRDLEMCPELRDFNSSRSRRNMEQFAHGLLLEFTIPQSAIDFNLDLAMSLDDEVMFG